MPGEPAMAAADLEAFKLATRRQWDQAASGWNAHAQQIRAWLHPATQAMLEMAGVRRGARVLDVAAGAGDQTLDIAQRVGADGYVLATDLSAAILAFAKANAARARHANVNTLVADGESLEIDAGSFDATVSRLGLMLFPDPRKGLREMYRALKPGGGICTMVFSQPGTNPCVTMLLSAALWHAGLPPQDPWQPGGLLSLGRPGLIDEMFRGACFREVATTRMDAPFRLPSAADYLRFIRSSASPLQQILGKLGAEAANAAWADMEERLKVYETAEGWTGPYELLLTAARR